jgi:hypothetical protein
VGAKDSIDPTAHDVKRCREVGSEKAVRHPAILEESTGNVQIEVSREVAPVSEEYYWEYGLSVGGVVARGDEAELRVGSDGVLNALESELLGGCNVVKAFSEFITEGNKLQKGVPLSMGVKRQSQPTYLLE